VVLVISKGDLTNALAGGSLLGDALILLGAISWVTYTLAASRFPGWSPLRFTVLTCIPGAAGLVIANVIAIGVGAAVMPTVATVAAVGWQILYFAVCTVLNFIPVGVFGIEAALGRSFALIELAGAVVVIAALVANNLYLRGTRTSR
jgi:drug/metabolite transporter (DMT)-like permease